MNSDKLSLRLETVAKYIPLGSSFADIGSDHAYLPCYVAKRNKISFAVAGEVVEGPYNSAVKQVKQEGLTEIISVRKGNGLEVISPNEVQCITIAGMGGALIAEILEQGKSKLSSVNRLILQPNVSAYSVRKWLVQNGWELINEEIIEEDNKIYEVLVAERGDVQKQYESDKEKLLLLGPFLVEEKNKVFEKKWLMEKNNWEKILKQLENAPDTLANRRKSEELIEKIKLIEEVIGR
ncbi:MAG TPA: tRNA (adenine(22)-N(1))-methyltransferase TrmK [Niallia sp.]|nr:tRNA (adenine(22)-N(1))-methyltransferase TrmK [Niallia sp.]